MPDTPARYSQISGAVPSSIAEGAIVNTELERLPRDTLGYFLHETNTADGLVIDKTAPDWLSSIAATGLVSPVIGGRPWIEKTLHLLGLINKKARIGAGLIWLTW